MSIQVIYLFSLAQTAVYAGHQKPVSTAVESARRQGVPEETLSRLLAYALDNQLGADHTVHILLILIRVRESQFPLHPFVDKIQEGLAKQIEPERLEDGLNKFLDDYKFVHQLLKNKYAGSRIYSENDLTDLVETLGFGINRQELRLLFNRAPDVPPEMIAVAAKNKALLKQLAFDDKMIDDILFTGLRNQSLTPQWSLFFKIASAARQKGISSTRIAEVAKDVLIQNGDLKQVLTEFEFTSRDVRHGPHLDSPPVTDEENN